MQALQLLFLSLNMGNVRRRAGADLFGRRVCRLTRRRPCDGNDVPSDDCHVGLREVRDEEHPFGGIPFARHGMDH